MRLTGVGAAVEAEVTNPEVGRFSLFRVAEVTFRADDLTVVVSFTTASFRAKGLATGFFLAPAAGLDGIRKRKLEKEGRLVKTDNAPMPDFIPIPHRLSYEKLAPGLLAPSPSNKKEFE